MEKGLWRSVLHRVTRVGHDLVTKPPRDLKKKLTKPRSSMKSTHSYDIMIDQVDKISQLIKAVEVLKSVSLSPDGFVQTQITGVHPRVLLQLVWVGAWILHRWTFSKENYLRRDGVLLKGEGLQRQRWSNKELVSEASRNLKDLGGGSTSPGGSQQRLEMTQGKPPALGFRGETWGQTGNFTPNLCFQGFPGGSDGKESACNAADLGSIPGLERSPGGGHGNPHQYSCLENPTNRGAWWATAHVITKSRTRLSD